MGLALEHSAYARAADSARGCWYYLRYFFLFVSLIQFLIILGLVLFMVYGNVHVATEAHLKDTERRAQELFQRVTVLSAEKANLTKQLNVTTHAKDTVMQMLLTARRELDRINASFRQCQVEKTTLLLEQQLVVAIILSEQRCQDKLKETNKTCEALLFKLSEKTKTLEMEVAKEKAVCSKDKEGLLTGKRLAEEQLAACKKVQEHHQQEKQVAEEQLSKVQALCFPLDKDKFEVEARNLWRDSIIPRTLDTLGYPYHSLAPELASIRRSCDHMPSLMTSKVEELARSLRGGIERVAGENADLKRQKFGVERDLRASQEAREKVVKEASTLQSDLQSQCQKQMQLALEEKATLRKERDGLARELDDKKRQVEQLKMEVEVRVSALDACVKAKSPPLVPPRPVVPGPQTPPLDPASVEEFKKKILESHRSPFINPAVPPRETNLREAKEVRSNVKAEL